MSGLGEVIYTKNNPKDKLAINNGTFINLTDLNNNTIKKLEYYIDYFKKQLSKL